MGGGRWRIRQLFVFVLQRARSAFPFVPLTKREKNRIEWEQNTLGSTHNVLDRNFFWIHLSTGTQPEAHTETFYSCVDYGRRKIFSSNCRSGTCTMLEEAWQQSWLFGGWVTLVWWRGCAGQSVGVCRWRKFSKLLFNNKDEHWLPRKTMLAMKKW